LAGVPSRHAFALPDDLPTTYAALVEPFAVGLHGVHCAEVSRGENVLVVGAGGVGLTTIAWARERSRACDGGRPRPTAPKAGNGHGRDRCVGLRFRGRVRRIRRGHRVCRAPELLQPCQSAARRLGPIVISGACAEPIGIEPVTALLKELTVRFSVCYRPDEFRDVIDTFGTGAINPAPMVGPMVGLNRIADAFDLVRSTAVHGRVLVTPGHSM
jgi:(R,R)-butanediol dehydrogenase / meso-butanediol dehydrogenase / diacetyl reductase